MVTRRDFLNGVALATAARRLAPRDLLGLAAVAPRAALYPPALTGLRGSPTARTRPRTSCATACSGSARATARDTGEAYDLVVVGGGVSGLSAAYFFRQAAGPAARILVLDNHDDFGGHARRNEFTHGGPPVDRLRRQLLDREPRALQRGRAAAWCATLGVDVARWPQVVDRRAVRALGLRAGVFFDRETFGADRLLPTPPMTDLASEAAETAPAPPDAWTAFLAEAPLHETAKRDLLRLHTERVDYLPGLTSAQKKARLARMSYADFLTGPARCDRQVAGVLPGAPARPLRRRQRRRAGAGRLGPRLPGLRRHGPLARARPRHEPRRGAVGRRPSTSSTSPTATRRSRACSCARSSRRRCRRVRRTPWCGARCDYGTLDAAGAPVRLRLDSTVGEGRAPRRRGGARGRGHLRARERRSRRCARGAASSPAGTR